MNILKTWYTFYFHTCVSNQLRRFHCDNYYLIFFLSYSPVVSCRALFCVSAEDSPLPKPQLNCIAYSLLVAQQLILLNWKNDKPPSFGRWLCEVMLSLKVEKIRYTLNGSMDKFGMEWHPFIFYVEQLTVPLDLCNVSYVWAFLV